MRSELLTSIVIPVYRSERYLRRTVDELRAFFASRGPFEIVLVNDGSPDGVQRVIEELASEDARVRWLELGSNVGQHRAVLRGLAAAAGDVVVTVDDDGQNPPEAAWKVASELRERDLDVVYGGFTTIEQSAMRTLSSRLNRWLTRTTLGNGGDLPVSNVRAIRGELARVLGQAEVPYPYIDAMIFRSTRRIGAVQVEHRPRAEGGSTYGLSRLLRLWLSHLTTLTAVPLTVAAVGSFAASALGLAVGLVQLVRALLIGQAPAGWLSLFVALTFFFSVLFAFLGVIGIYLGRLYVSLNARGLVWERSRALEPLAAHARARKLDSAS